ncbi:hypothetical protein KGF57_002590 [Candida theae]|uniref:Uncharacterized protein n=1 Tax=Candida theae TaxID=1198502 RepID=A0AAD5BEW9_9ASCO|nr:uncharacterized protein KGF57_002590 [Candida theae]KAI5958235.1 hypothetical protein KGF57_002590 [Candida theae]
MDSTPDEQVLLEKYMETYVGQLTDISSFYANIDWKHVTKITKYNDVETLKLTIDEFFDRMVMDQDLQLSNFVARWGKSDTPLYSNVSQMMDSIGILPFKEVADATSTSEGIQKNPVPEIEPSSKARDMPKLTKNQRRLSLELMQRRPNLYTTTTEGQLFTTAAASVTNLNVTTMSKPVLESTLSDKVNSETGLGMKTRRTSLVNEQLPKYIREQLRQGQQPVQKITPKPSVRKFISNNLAPISDMREVSRKPSRLQNVVTNSQSLYAHSNDVNSTSNTSEIEHQLRYDTDDDDREYISPASLAKYYGVQFEEGSDVEYDNDDDDDEDEEEEDTDFVKVPGGASDDDGENDYLFKV